MIDVVHPAIRAHVVVVVEPAQGWKVALAAVLLAAIVLSACARAPRRAVACSELRRLVLAALVLYGAGVFASSRHYPIVSAAAYATGISICALAAWLSRGIDSEDPPRGWDGDGDGDPPPPEPDWDAWEREFRSYPATDNGDGGNICVPSAPESGLPSGAVRGQQQLV